MGKETAKVRELYRTPKRRELRKEEQMHWAGGLLLRTGCLEIIAKEHIL